MLIFNLRPSPVWCVRWTVYLGGLKGLATRVMTSVLLRPDASESGRGDRVQGPTWRKKYARLLMVTDLLVVTWAVVGAYTWRLNPEIRIVSVGNRYFSPDVPITYATVALVVLLAWWGALALFDSRQPRILGVGAEEYKRVFQASFAVFGGMAILAYLMTADVARSFLAVALPAGMIGLCISRALCRELLRIRRRAGDASTKTIIAGPQYQVSELLAEFQDRPEIGYDIVGVCLDDADAGSVEQIGNVPVVGATKNAVEVMQSLNSRALVVAASKDLGPKELQDLGWALDKHRAELIMSPALTNVAGPRIHIRPVSGMPLLHVEGPRLPRSGALIKGTFDRLGSAILILCLSPIFLAVAAAVKGTSKGPALYLQERIGENGEPFKVFKFRSMKVGADAELAALLAAQGTGDVPLFKPENDPRITKVGHFIRKYSLDELPQLFNVLFGTMSLVGPRPQRQSEVDLYEDGAERRLLCKPGMTGLWQVSGRSDMPWQKAMRLDVYYVENWSFTFDLLLLWRTVGVVLRGSGAR